MRGRVASSSASFDPDSDALLGSRRIPIEPTQDVDETTPGADPGEQMSGRPEQETDPTGDCALMGGVREGRTEAFRQLVERYWAQLVTYAAGIVGAREAAKDVVQDVFIRVWRHREEWSSGGSVSAYLYRITRNLSLNSRRDRQARSRRDERGALELSRSMSVPSPHEELEADTLRREVEAAIEALPERRREVFVLSRFHGLSHREIAETMGISPQTVSNQMSAALAALRERLGHLLEDR